MAKSQFKFHPRYGFYILIMVVGWVLPPIAVLLRFGIGSDFFLNILLTLCGYIPGHGHNFYLQNIRNNHNKKRTPQWAARAGLIKDPAVQRKAKTQWANRYDERTPTRADGYQDEDDSIERDRRRNYNNSSNTLDLPFNQENHLDQLEARDLENFSQSTSSNSRSNHLSSPSDPYSIRRRGSVDSTSQRSSFTNSNLNSSKKSLHRSISQKFRFGKKLEKKNRFDRANSSKLQWDQLSSQPIQSSGDGLNHVF
ncbi:hypothetical protein O181_098967 [Austropuccinia psidii MF-1]|uniref:Uncharacterized protein n=1 Tax=Austropuccinia psidii MF-1 TaxID=1389203 RepID=A0A9Q3PG28_9BASI|nr:hypothetical protein [Austropuccinia psidii MF-1]